MPGFGKKWIQSLGFRNGCYVPFLHLTPKPLLIYKALP